MKHIIFFILIVSITITSCYKDNEETLYPPVAAPPVTTVTTTGTNTGTTKVSYATDIQPLFTTTCSGSTCHQSGTFQQNFQIYSIASADIDNIITRINLSTNSSSFMPLGGVQYTATQLALVQQWKTDGVQP